MTTPLGPGALGPRDPAVGEAAARAQRDARLRETAQQLEGVFVAQLYQAMRATVPEDGLFSGGSGEAMFTGLMDEHIAQRTPESWQGRGLAEALVRQLRGMAPAPEPEPPT